MNEQELTRIVEQAFIDENAPHDYPLIERIAKRLSATLPRETVGWEDALTLLRGVVTNAWRAGWASSLRSKGTSDLYWIGNKVEFEQCLTAIQLPRPTPDAVRDGGWISVQDRLPEIDKLVLVTQCGVGGHDLKSYEDRIWKARLHENGDWWTCDTVLPSRVYSVINWMPLPQPPALAQSSETGGV